MALKTFRPLTPSNRFKALPAFEEITKTQAGEERCVETKKKTGGRNNYGRITSPPHRRRSQAEVPHHRFQAQQARRARPR